MQTVIKDSPNTMATVRGRVKWTLVTIALLTIFMVGVEVSSRLLVPRISKIEGRTKREFDRVFPPPSSNKPLVLLMGNSLMLAAIQFDTFTVGVSDLIEPRRLVVEQTGYHDWYYGIKYLLEHGAKPHTVVLMLSPVHLIGDTWRGEYTAQLMMTPRDAFQLAQDIHLHPTETTSLVFSSVSYFYGLRGEIRKVILGRLIPNMSLLTWRLVTVPTLLPPPKQIEKIAAERLKSLDRLCKSHGVKFTFLLAPSWVDNGASSVIRAGSDVGVNVLSAAPPSLFTKADFPDGFHASVSATKRYTPAAIDVIRSQFSR